MHLLFVSKYLPNKKRIFKTRVCFDLTCSIIINSMRVRLQVYLFIFLSVRKRDKFF